MYETSQSKLKMVSEQRESPLRTRATWETERQSAVQAPQQRDVRGGGFADRGEKRGTPLTGRRGVGTPMSAPATQRAARSRSVGDTGSKPRQPQRLHTSPSPSPAVSVRSLSSQNQPYPAGRRTASPGSPNTRRMPHEAPPAQPTPFSSRGTPTSTRNPSMQTRGVSGGGSAGAGGGASARSTSGLPQQVTYDLDRWRAELSLLEGRLNSDHVCRENK